ncbi:hypothetical protein D3C71_22810 [compost metagenome]
MEEPSTKDLFKLLAPFLAGTVLASVLAVLVLLRFVGVPGVSAGGPMHAVTFDVVKFSNAQRAVASAFIKRNADVAEANDLLLGLSERTRKTIEDVAGPGTVVLVKQSVAQGVDRDITDEVLKRLGLPTDLPTKDAAAYTLDVAPTMLLQPIIKQSQPPVLPSGKDVLP